jgi:hypothetical protein
MLNRGGRVGLRSGASSTIPTIAASPFSPAMMLLRDWEAVL